MERREWKGGSGDGEGRMEGGSEDGEGRIEVGSGDGEERMERGQWRRRGENGRGQWRWRGENGKVPGRGNKYKDLRSRLLRVIKEDQVSQWGWVQMGQVCL